MIIRRDRTDRTTRTDRTDKSEKTKTQGVEVVHRFLANDLTLSYYSFKTEVQSANTNTFRKS